MSSSSHRCSVFPKPAMPVISWMCSRWIDQSIQSNWCACFFFENVVPTKFGRCYKFGTRTGPSEGRGQGSDAHSSIIGNTDTEVVGQDEVLWKFGGVRWVSQEKIVKKYLKNFRFVKSSSCRSVVPQRICFFGLIMILVSFTFGNNSHEKQNFIMSLEKNFA